jgi:hypothetical protein
MLSPFIRSSCSWLTLNDFGAGASDATYHVMWIILFNALDDFGVREVNEVVRMGSPPSVTPNYLQIDAAKRKVTDEASHGALRIAGLVRLFNLAIFFICIYPSIGRCSDIEWLSGGWSQLSRFA